MNNKEYNVFKGHIEKIQDSVIKKQMFILLERLHSLELNSNDAVKYTLIKDRISAIIKDKRYTMSEIADMLHITRPYLSSLISHKYPNKNSVDDLLNFVDSLPASDRKKFHEDGPELLARIRKLGYNNRQFIDRMNIYCDPNTFIKALRGKTNMQDMAIIYDIYATLEKLERENEKI